MAGIPLVATDKCSSCNEEELITGLRQDFDKDGNLVLECDRCYLSRLGLSDNDLAI